MCKCVGGRSDYKNLHGYPEYYIISKNEWRPEDCWRLLDVMLLWALALCKTAYGLEVKKSLGRTRLEKVEKWIETKMRWPWTSLTKVELGLVWFYSISNIVGYLMLNPVFTYIINIWIINIFCIYTQLNDQRVLFLTILFSISQQS